jgi:hypothetical protein
MSETASRTEMEHRIVQRTLDDESFRERLLEDPRGVVERKLEAPLPAEVQVTVVEETPEPIYLVLPHSGSSAGQDPEEVSDQDLEAVAGGAGEHATQDACVSGQNTCSTCGGWGC